MTGRSPGAVLPLFYGSEEFAQPGFLADAAEPSDGQLRSGGQLRRNLFGPAAESEIYRGLGPSPEQRRATRHMMRELAVHMKLCQWPGAKHSLDNPEIPAGYTYLAQLAAHDIVSNTAPLPRLDDPPTFFARDYRIDRLTLETIYGAGPAMTPLPFAIDGGDVKKQRHDLRLGHVPKAEPVGNKIGLPMMDQAARDIARIACPYLNDAPGRGVPDALIADPRNDDHLIISQLTALFHQLHNIIYAKLSDAQAGPSSDFQNYRQFLEARKIAALAYRSVIINDLLKLLLEPEVYKYYSSSATKYPEDFLDPTNDGRVPVEFSHAAYRFGHVMARFSYALTPKQMNGPIYPKQKKLAEVLDRSSSRAPEMLPVACNWLVDWSYFFKRPKDPPLPGFNFSRPIQPFVGISQGSRRQRADRRLDHCADPRSGSKPFTAAERCLLSPGEDTRLANSERRAHVRE
ncbi:MAG: peroxidase family protein [Microvirga sp.]